jgi:hypothetical protein
MQRMDPQPAETAGGRTPPPFLVIVRREAEDLYRTLQLQFEDEPHVQVIWDRRVAERRVRTAPVIGERRSRDRRGLPPVSWGLGVLFVPEETHEPDPGCPLPASRP